MRLRRELRNPWAVAPIVAAILAIAWACVAVAVDCPEIIVDRIGDKSAFIGWKMPENEYDIDDFGGYRLWMRELWKGDEFSLLREYVLHEDDPEAAGYWHFPEWYEEAWVCTIVVNDTCVVNDTINGWVRGVRRDSAAFFTNAFPYQFSVTTFSASDPQALNYECREDNLTEIIYPRVGTRGDLSAVRCIPNPYRASADWEYGGQRRVAFIGLPEKATIRIYTVAADHVVTLEHNDAESDLEFWDLNNKNNEEIAPGVYIFQVESDGLGNIDGKVMIIK
ncbi:MAG: hypothetical protein KAW67_06105 [Candidatus Eisenbacteria sp.]|nr:hypothetical protein [Candidatus Eisenbacteria bacterium]